MNIISVLHCKNAFSDALEGVVSNDFRSFRSRIYNLLSSLRLFSTDSLFNVQNLECISVSLAAWT